MKTNFIIIPEKARCSHFLSVCYLANSILHNKKALGVPCPRGCVMSNQFPYIFNAIANNEIDTMSGKLKYFKLGQDTPDRCVDKWTFKLTVINVGQMFILFAAFMAATVYASNMPTTVRSTRKLDIWWCVKSNLIKTHFDSNWKMFFEKFLRSFVSFFGKAFFPGAFETS